MRDPRRQLAKFGKGSSKVLDWNLQEQLYQHMSNLVPLPAIYKPDFIAANQESRANNVLEGSNQQLVDQVRNFKG